MKILLRTPYKNVDTRKIKNLRKYRKSRVSSREVEVGKDQQQGTTNHGR